MRCGFQSYIGKVGCVVFGCVAYYMNKPVSKLVGCAEMTVQKCFRHRTEVRPETVKGENGALERSG